MTMDARTILPPHTGPDPRLGRLFAALRRGNKRALARAVSLVEDDAPEAQELIKLCREALRQAQRALRIGITGPAGAGKSTLIDALTQQLRAQDRRVGIVAVDPSSAFSGGTILGDRIRIREQMRQIDAHQPYDTGVYMRSMATRGHWGGLAKATDDVLTVIEAAFPDPTANNILLIETTGVGQGEIEIARLADLVAVILVPGMGDSVQSLKAGVLEIASVFVLNKADREGIVRLESEISEMLGLSAAIGEGSSSADNFSPKIVRTIAITGQGVSELIEILEGLANAASSESRRHSLLPPTKRPSDSTLPVLDHIGIATRSISDSFALYKAIGIDVSRIEDVSQEHVRVAMMAVGESRIELLEATDADSAIAKFIARRGPGLHHIALRVRDLAASVQSLKENGVRLVTDRIQVGAGGHQYVFVHPESPSGVLIELVQASDSDLEDRN